MELGHSTAKESSSDLASQFRPIERFGGRLKPFIEYLAKIVTRGKFCHYCFASILPPRGTLGRTGIRDKGSGVQAILNFSKHPSPKAGHSLPNLESANYPDHRFRNLRLGTTAAAPASATREPKPPKPPTQTCILATGLCMWITASGAMLVWSRRTLEGLEREFLCIEYKNGDQVYVPIHQADRLTRYIGPDGSPPAPGSLGTQEWPETKRKVREAVQEVAQESARPVCPPPGR